MTDSIHYLFRAIGDKIIHQIYMPYAKSIVAYIMQNATPIVSVSKYDGTLVVIMLGQSVVHVVVHYLNFTHKAEQTANCKYRV
jgi:hypothetical protein